MFAWSLIFCKKFVCIHRATECIKKGGAGFSSQKCSEEMLIVILSTYTSFTKLPTPRYSRYKIGGFAGVRLLLTSRMNTMHVHWVWTAAAAAQLVAMGRWLRKQVARILGVYE